MRLLFSLIVLLYSVSIYTQDTDSRVCGITLVAPRDSFASNPMLPLNNIHCGWIAVVPYAFTPANESKLYFGNNHQWWGETPRGAEHTIKLAHANGIKVMLKPQVWMHGSWVGEMDYGSDEEWRQWETDYRSYIMEFARMAERNKVELLCIGTEFKIAVVKRTKFWKDLIKDIRDVYGGKITYCSNWDSFDQVPIWAEVDLIGISAYFPLSESRTPSINELTKAWSKVKPALRKLSKRYKGKGILFTEYGYMSVDGCAGKTWELESKRMSLNANQLAQANAIEAMFQSFCDESYWKGGFLWKWYPNKGSRNYSAFRERDYTPQGKMAEETLMRWFSEIAP